MNSKLFYILILIATCFVSSVSQVLLKKAALAKYPSFLTQYMNMNILLAYFMFFVVLVVNTYILRYIPMFMLSAISETLPYVFSIFFGFMFFGEKIKLRKICGAIIIIIGIGVLVI